MLEPALADDVRALQRDNARLKRTIANHSAKLEEVVNHLMAVETMIDGMRREIKENGQRAVLTFKARPLAQEEEKDGGV